MAAMPHDLIDRSSAEEAPAATGSGRAEAPALARGICRLLEDLGYATLTEFTLRSGRRVDVIGLDGGVDGLMEAYLRWRREQGVPAP